MSDFFKHFLTEEADRMNPETGRYAALAAFGKHPGWDDHIEDIGLDTGSLSLARLVLYAKGVGGQIDAGAWEKLKESQRLAAFNHTFVWLRGNQFLLARMWSSSDGKGRTRYPMLLCAHFVGVSLAWAMEEALPQLEEAEKACRSAKTAAEVRAIADRTRDQLRRRVNDPAAVAPRGGSAHSILNQFVAAPAFGADREGWFRILYWLQSQAREFGVGRFRPGKGKSAARALHLRVPLGLLPSRAVPLWARFFALHLDPQVPMLMVWAADQEWMDAVLGEPGSHEFFCLRAGPGALPLATEIPYNFDSGFRELAVRQLTAFQTGSEQLPEAGPQPGASATGRWIRNVAGMLLLLLVLVGLAVIAVPYLRNWIESRPVEAAGPVVEVSAKPAPPVPDVAPTNPESSTVATSAVPTAPEYPPSTIAVGEKVITNGIGMILLWVEGLPDSGGGGWVGKYEVRQTEFQKVAGSNPSWFAGPGQPVENVNWNEAMDFCRKLSEQEAAAGRLPEGYAYTLPSRKQWDYFLDDATFEDRGFENAVTSRGHPNLRDRPAPVGSMPENRFGLCDVLGNVWEWCADSDASDNRMLKGGAYNSGMTFQLKPLERTTSCRLPPDARFPDAGFRCVVALAR